MNGLTTAVTIVLFFCTHAAASTPAGREALLLPVKSLNPSGDATFSLSEFVRTSGLPAVVHARKKVRGCRRCAKRNFSIVNKYRSQNRKSQLTWNRRLARMSFQHSKKMFDQRRLYHSSHNVYENVAFSAGYATWKTSAQLFFDDWKSSPGHNANMLETAVTCMGVGIYGDGRTFYATQMFLRSC